MMGRLKIILALMVFILAQETFTKSIKKKHSKKESIPKKKAHYLLLMGSPVEDEHHHKGLGMILSSNQGEPHRVQESQSKEDRHHYSKQKPGLAATLQTSLKGSPSDRGYSYTEALFTGAPLFNGRPFAEPHKTHANQDGDNVGQTVNGNDKPTGNDKSTGSAMLNVDGNNGHHKGETNGQVQKEVHTEDGVWGIAVNTRPKESHPSSEERKEEHTNSIDNVEHQYLIPRLSVDASPYKSHGKIQGTAKYTQIDQMEESSPQIENHKENLSSIGGLSSYSMRSNQYEHGENSIKGTESDHPVERVHQILVTGETQENFPTKPYDRGLSVEDHNVNNRLPEKTYIKGYDEESNLLGSSVLHHGKLDDKHGDSFLGQHHEFNPKMITGSNWKAHSKQTEYSSHKTGMDTSSSGIGRFEKETSAFPSEESSNALSNGLKVNEGVSRVGGESKPQQEHSVHEQFYQNYSQHIESHLKGARESNNQGSHGTYESRKIPRVKAYNSSAMPSGGVTSSKGSSGFGSFISQLRPHKIIESAFDEELTHRIITGPSNSHSQPLKQSTEQQTEDTPSHFHSDNTFLPGKQGGVSPPSLPYREDVSLTTLSQESERTSTAKGEGSVEPLPPSSEASPDESLNNSHNEEETQDTTSNHLASERPEHEDVFTNDASSQKEQENTEVPQRIYEHGPDAIVGSGEISSNLARQPLTQSEVTETQPQLPFGEDSSSTTGSPQHEIPSKGQGQQSIEASLIGSNGAEATNQEETSPHQHSGSAIDTTLDHVNTVANGADSQQRTDEQTSDLQSSVSNEPDTNNGRSDNSYTSQVGISNEQGANKEIEASLHYGEVGNQDTFGHGNVGEQLPEASPISDEKVRVVSLNSQTEETRQQDKSIEGSSASPVHAENSNHDQQQVESSQNNNEQDTETYPGTSENLNFSGKLSSKGKANQDTSSSLYPEGSKPETEHFGNEQTEKPEEALSPARIGPSNSNNMETSMQQGTSYQAEHKNAYTQGVKNQEGNRETETSLTNAEHETASNYEPSDNFRNSPELNDKQHQIKVGTPEEETEIPTAEQSKVINEEQVLMPFYGAKIHSHSPSQGINNNQSKGNDQDNKNQRIVYFLKMAKGIPLLNTRKAANYAEGKTTENRGPEENYSNTIIKEDHSMESTPETGIDVNGGRRYPWRWQRRPSRRPSPQTSWPRPQPQPYPCPSPSTGGGGGALGGSSVDSNQPQADSDFEQEALDTHNKYRKVHGVPDMTLDRDLSNQAKAYAQKIANMGQLIHSSKAERGHAVGENLAYACASNGTPLTGESATEMWYDEVCKPGYSFTTGGFSSGTGHFTQVVWKDSVKLGIGQGKATQNGMQCIYVVGRYEIAGNMMGEFQDQVLRGNFNKAYCNNVKK